MKYIIEKSEKIIKKPYQEVKKYDVVRFEYGDYNNWAEAIIINITPIENKMVKIEFEIEDGRFFVGYNFMTNGKCYFDIIGVAHEIKKEQSRDA